MRHSPTDEDWPSDPGRPLLLRLLAVLGALAFVMMGLVELGMMLTLPRRPPGLPDDPHRAPLA